MKTVWFFSRAVVIAVVGTACAVPTESTELSTSQAIEPVDTGKGWPTGGSLTAAVAVDYGASTDGVAVELVNALSRVKTLRPLRGEIFLQSRTYSPSAQTLAEFDKAIAGATVPRMKAALEKAREALAAGYSVTVKEAETSVVALDNGKENKYGITAVYRSKLPVADQGQRKATAAPRDVAMQGDGSTQATLIFVISSEGEVLLSAS